MTGEQTPIDYYVTSRRKKDRRFGSLDFLRSDVENNRGSGRLEVEFEAVDGGLHRCQLSIPWSRWRSRRIRHHMIRTQQDPARALLWGTYGFG
jgi:hypothetical protein